MERCVETTDPTSFIYLETTRVINVPPEPGANHSDLPEDLQFLPQFKNGKPYNRYYSLWPKIVLLREILTPSVQRPLVDLMEMVTFQLSSQMGQTPHQL